jgi:hypothetical protein
MLFIALAAVACSGGGDEPSGGALELSASGDEIVGDGVDKVTFYLSEGSKDVTDKAVFKMDGVALTGNSAVSKAKGTHTVTAEYGGRTSNAVSVRVVDVPPLVLEANKASIMADNSDKVTFTVKQGGKTVTSRCLICSSDGGICLSGNSYFSNKLGAINFYAYFKEDDPAADLDMKSNEVTVSIVPVTFESPNFSATRTLYKNVAMFVCAGSWCAACYDLKTNVKNLGGEVNSHIVMMNMYEPNQEAVSELKDRDLYVAVVNQFRENQMVGSAYPWYAVDMDELLEGSGGAAAMYDAAIARNPARVGIKVVSAASASKVDFTVTVGAKEAGTYHVNAFLVEDGIKANQNGSPEGNNYSHDGVMRAIAADNVYGVSLGEMTAGATKSQEFSIPVKSNFVVKNLSLVVYVMYDKEGKRVITNSVKAPAAGTTNFKFMD